MSHELFATALRSSVVLQNIKNQARTKKTPSLSFEMLKEHLSRERREHEAYGVMTNAVVTARSKA